MERGGTADQREAVGGEVTVGRGMAHKGQEDIMPYVQQTNGDLYFKVIKCRRCNGVIREEPMCPAAEMLVDRVFCDPWCECVEPVYPECIVVLPTAVAGDGPQVTITALPDQEWDQQVARRVPVVMGGQYPPPPGSASR